MAISAVHPLRPGPAACVRQLRSDERYAEALAVIEAERPYTGVEGRLLDAEEARLAYYQGRSATGLALAERIVGPSDLASARAALAASVNLLALNRGYAALERCNDAILRMRITDADTEDQIDARIQLVHVLSHMGDRSESIAAGQALVRLARRSRSSPRDRAEYALGFAFAFAGRQEAVAQLLLAERMARGRAGPVWHWILFCLANCLRDLGHVAVADAYGARSAVALRYERAWSCLRGDRPGSAVAWLQLPIRADERPYLRTVLAALRLREQTGRRRPNPSRSALAAAREFGRGGLQHWKWGALWIAASDPLKPHVERSRIAEELIGELEARGAVHWGFFDPGLALGWARKLRSTALVRHLEACLARDRKSPETLALQTLHLMTPEAVPVLTDVGLSPSEIRALVSLVDLWLDGSRPPPRTEVASRLGISDAALRTRICRIRDKFGIERSRGVGPLLAWLAERDLLTPPTASKAIRRLAGGPADTAA